MNDSFAYLPLLVATGAAFITIIILAANRERYHPVVITLHILCAILVGIVAVYIPPMQKYPWKICDIRPDPEYCPEHYGGTF